MLQVFEFAVDVGAAPEFGAEVFFEVDVGYVGIGFVEEGDGFDCFSQDFFALGWTEFGFGLQVLLEPQEEGFDFVFDFECDGFGGVEDFLIVGDAEFDFPG